MGSRKTGLLPRILGGDIEPGVSRILVTLALAVTAHYVAVAGLAAGALYWTGVRLVGRAPAPAADVAEAV